MTAGRTHSFETSWGANYSREGTRFRLWAPGADTVELVSGPEPGSRLTPMRKGDGGWWEITSWRTRSDVTVEELAADVRLQTLLRAVREERPEVS